MRLLAYILFLIFIAVVLSSCGKDGDTLNPKITILLPTSNQQFNVLSKINVRATVSDDHTIDWISLGLFDPDQHPVLPRSTVYPRVGHYDLEMEYDLNDIHLSSGTYEFRITAFDGVNTASGYVAIQLLEVPLELEQVVMITRQDDQVRIWSVTWDKQELLYTLSTDYSASCLSSRYRRLIVTGLFVENLVCLEWDTGYPDWSVEPMTDPPYHLPGNLFEGEQLLYVSFRNGFARGYDPMGVIRFATPFMDLMEPGRIFEHQEWLLADLKERSGHRRFMASYYLASGSEKNRIRTDVEVVNFHSLDENSVFVIGNKDNSGYIGICEVAGNRIWSPHVFQDGRITASISVDTDNLLIAGETRTFWYRYSLNSLTEWDKGSKVIALLYDDLYRQVYAVDSAGFSVYSFPGHQLTGHLQVEEEVLNVHLLYNK